MLKVAAYKGSIRGFQRLLKAIVKQNKDCQSGISLGYQPKEDWNYQDILRREG